MCVYTYVPLRTEILINFILDLKTALPKNDMELPNSYAIKLHPLNFKRSTGFLKMCSACIECNPKRHSVHCS